MQHGAAGLALADQLIDDRGDVALGFRLRAGLLEEFHKSLFELCEEHRIEGPKIHRDWRVCGDDPAFAVEADAADMAIILAADVHILLDLGKFAACIELADAAVDRAVIRKRVFQRITHHRHRIRIACLLDQKIRCAGIGIATVEVVGIDHRKRLFHRIACGTNRMGGAPRFFAAFGHGESGGQVAEFLKDIVDLNFIGKPRADSLLEGLCEILADDEDHAAEARADGIEDRIVEHGFTMRAHRVHLFEATVAAAHSGGEDEESWFHESASCARHARGGISMALRARHGNHRWLPMA